MHAMRFGGFVRDEPAYHAARRRQTNLVVSSFKERRALEYDVEDTSLSSPKIIEMVSRTPTPTPNPNPNPPLPLDKVGWTSSRTPTLTPTPTPNPTY